MHYNYIIAILCADYVAIKQRLCDKFFNDASAYIQIGGLYPYSEHKE